MAEMRAGDRIAEHGGEEQSLGDLGALLVLLQARRLGGELGIARQQSREFGRGAAAELIGAQEAASALGEPVVDAGGVRAQIGFARGAVGGVRWRWKRVGSHGANYRPAGSWR